MKSTQRDWRNDDYAQDICIDEQDENIGNNSI